MTSRGFRIVLVVLLAVLTLQGWTGDTVNIFAPVTSITPPGSFGLFAGLEQLGSFAVWHGAEGILLSFLSIAVFAASFLWSGSRGVRIASLLGLFFVFSAAYGGYEFVMSGLSDAGASAQMGGSFIGAYAFYFIALYYSRNTQEAKLN
jgi:hypothetical protein